MHILLVVPWFTRPGAEGLGSYFRDQAHALKDSGHTVGIVYPCQASILNALRQPLWRYCFRTVSFQTERSIPVLCNLGYAIPRAYRLNQAVLTWQLEDLVNRYVRIYGRPDLVHAHSSLLLGVPTGKVSARRSLPLVITEHQSTVALATLTASQREHIRQAVAMARATVSVSQDLAERIGAISQSRDIRVIPNMVDTGFFFPRSDLPMEPASSGYKILCVAWLVAGKRLNILLQAFAKAFKNNDDVYLEIGGRGPELGKLRTLAARLGIGRRVLFLGELNRDQVRTQMGGANLFVLPSAYETFGVVLIEAIASGLPVIGTSTGGQKEIISAKVGRLVSPDDIDELATAMQAEYEMRQQRFAERAAIAIEAKRSYSKEVVVEMLERVYKKATEAEKRC